MFPVFTGEWNEFARCESKESNMRDQLRINTDGGENAQ